MTMAERAKPTRSALTIPARIFALLALSLAGFVLAQERTRPLPPFLEVFRGKPVKIVERPVRIASASGPVNGFLARKEGDEALPAVLLLHDESGLTDWMRQNARDLAEIGFVTLAIESKPPPSDLTPTQAYGDEETLARQSA